MTTLFGSRPQLAVIMIFGLESAILPASSFAENPPKTIEWMAPNLAQAQVANNAYGIMGS